MTYLLNDEIACTFCKYPNHADIWTIINVKLDPELKDLLMGGELNMIECESCKKIFYADQFLLYHDPAEELMAFVYPLAAGGDKDTYLEKTKTDFEMSQMPQEERDRVTYQPVTVFGLDALVALVEGDEENSIQSEIVHVLSQEKGFPIQTLRPSEARLQHMPRVLPFRDKAGLEEGDLLAGLAMIEHLNPLLSVYTEARKRVLANIKVN